PPTVGCMAHPRVAAPGGCGGQEGGGAAGPSTRRGPEMQMALTPGEALTRLAIGDATVMGVKDAMADATHHLWLNPSPDFLGYLIPCDEYNHPPAGDDTYEEGVSLGTCADDWIARPLRRLIETDECAR